MVRASERGARAKVLRFQGGTDHGPSVYLLGFSNIFWFLRFWNSFL